MTDCTDTAYVESTDTPEETATSPDLPEHEASQDESAPIESVDTDEIEQLREEVKVLKAQLEGERAMYGRMSRECAEFSELYPEVPLSAIPDDIWDSVKKGVPIAAAYALSERKSFLARARAESVNSENSRLSSGSVDSSSNEEYFSPAEVRAMSASEVRANYSTIIRSMSKWH